MATGAAIAWGVFAFGAVYPWSYFLLVCFCSIASAAAWVCTQDGQHAVSKTLLLAITFPAIAVAAQLVPLSSEMLAWLSPETPRTLAELSPSYALGLRSTHALSIAPKRTMIALLLFVTFAILMLATARLTTARGPLGLASVIVVIGVLVALVGIAQQQAFTGKIYGFWSPQFGGAIFGPFVNKNHFAGWMLMAIPLTSGLLCAQLRAAVRSRPLSASDVVPWLSSPSANGVVLTFGAVAIMTLSLVMTMSRSAMMALSVALLMLFSSIWRVKASRWSRAISLAVLMVAGLIALALVDAQLIGQRFADLGASALEHRRGIWRDAFEVFYRFPVTGTGLNTYGVSMLLFQTHDPARHYAQAHNDYLQLAAEGGVMVLLPVIVFGIVVVAEINKRFHEPQEGPSHWLRVGATSGLAAIAVQELAEFSLQMPGNAALFAVLCGIALHRPMSGSFQERKVSSDSRPPKGIGLGVSHMLYLMSAR